MTTQTLRGMLEPLHWRGDRSTMAAFNGAFVTLLGAANVQPGNNPEGGLASADMDLFRAFALGIRFPPNPFRNLDDTIPNTDLLIPGHVVTGNPTEGAVVFDLPNTDGPLACSDCHSSIFGSAGGKLDGVEPSDPPEARAGLINGDLVLSFHSDIKVPHLRNLYDKFGPTFGTASTPLASKTGFGFGHDGALPNLGTFFAATVFQLTAEQIRDVTAFLLHWPSSQRPAVGHQVTVPPGAAPTGSPAQESRLGILLTVGDTGDVNRHCDLTASAEDGGRVSTWRLGNGQWIPDLASGAPVSTTTLREAADGAITFFCGTVGSGDRLGLDWDEDGTLNGDDCAPANPAAGDGPIETSGLGPDPEDRDALIWIEVDPAARYDILSGNLSDVAVTGLDTLDCIAEAVPTPRYHDGRQDPIPGDGYFYLVRTVNSCGQGPLGPGRESVTPTCSVP